MVFPMALARKLSSLRYLSFFSLIISLYIILAIVVACLFDRGVNPDLGESFSKAFTNLTLTGAGIFNSLPLVIFSFMYQTNLPMIYQELEEKNTKQMWKILFYGTVGACFLYLLAGIFGYITFAADPKIDDLMNSRNILLCYPGGSSSNILSLFGI
jgi:amino acid permease